MSQRRWVVCLTFAVLSALPLPSFAQRTTGDVSGSITDGTGGVLPGATVTAVCTATNQSRNTTTDAQGTFTIPALPICLYRVTAEIAGFKTVVRDVEVARNGGSNAARKLSVRPHTE